MGVGEHGLKTEANIQEIDEYNSDNPIQSLTKEEEHRTTKEHSTFYLKKLYTTNSSIKSNDAALSNKKG